LISGASFLIEFGCWSYSTVSLRASTLESKSLNSKVLVFFKFILLLSLMSSFYWANELIESDLLSSLVVLCCGLFVPAAWKASTLVPDFTLKGIGAKTPIWTALVVIPFMLLIPLGFQSQLLEAFNSWVGVLRSTDFNYFSWEKLLDLITLAVPLALGGSYLLVVLLAFQVFSKRVVDHFCGESI
jgi:hypothetical protein